MVMMQYWFRALIYWYNIHIFERGTAAMCNGLCSFAARCSFLRTSYILTFLYSHIRSISNCCWSESKTLSSGIASMLHRRKWSSIDYQKSYLNTSLWRPCKYFVYLTKYAQVLYVLRSIGYTKAHWPYVMNLTIFDKPTGIFRGE